MSAEIRVLCGELEEAISKATPGPWQYDPSEGDTVWDADEQRPSIIALARDPYGHCEDDAALIVAAVNALPTLTAAVRAVLDLCDEADEKVRRAVPASGAERLIASGHHTVHVGRLRRILAEAEQ